MISLEFLYLDRRWSFGALLDFETYPVAFRQALETAAFDCAVVNEDVFSAAFNRDKTKTLLIVEPLYRTLRHSLNFLLIYCLLTFFGCKLGARPHKA